MEDLENQEEKTQMKKTPFTFLGEPIIKTYCQRNCFISAISGGIFTGLVTFLFTSNVRFSTRAAMGSFFVIGVTYACYCTYDEIQMKKQYNMLRKARYEAKLANLSKKIDP